MTQLQKWVLVLAALIASFSVAYYLLVYIPKSQETERAIVAQQERANIKKQASIECKKGIDEALDNLPAPRTQEQMTNQAQLIVELTSPEHMERCINRVLSDWGYK